MVNRFDSRPIVTYHYRDFPLGELMEAKGDQVVSVCIPAHDEAATVGEVVSKLRLHLMERAPLIDEVLVIDDHSSDRTADAADVLPQVAGGNGKGEALWRSLHAAAGDIVAWCDADITDFGARFVVGLLGPLLLRPDIAFVKGYYERPMDTGDTGGRTTELMARPLLATLFPHLATIKQPLSGEYAGRRSLLEQLPFVRGYGVDLAMLIDVAEVAGTAAIAQVDLGTRRHRNRQLDQLGPQALVVLQAALNRAGVQSADPAILVRPGRDPLPIAFGELPPLAALVAEA
jgi:glucosyl-3-phosphoglycerate synthase